MPLAYPLVRNERHVQKEGYGCTLQLCIGPKDSHDSTFGQGTLILEGIMSVQSGSFQCTIRLNIFGMIQKRVMPLSIVNVLGLLMRVISVPNRQNKVRLIFRKNELGAFSESLRPPQSIAGSIMTLAGL